TRLIERVPIPLGVHSLALGIDGRIRRHRVNAPVNEDAELGIGIPGRAGPLVDGFPGGLIAILAKNAAAGGQRQRSRHASAEKVTASHGVESHGSRLARGGRLSLLARRYRPEGRYISSGFSELWGRNRSTSVLVLAENAPC